VGGSAAANGLTWLAGDGMLTALDASDPAQPRIVARQTLPGWPWALAVAGDKVFVAMGSSGLLTMGFATAEAGAPLYLPAVARR
jgi:hypothetical protein